MRYNGDRPIEGYFGPPRSLLWDRWWQMKCEAVDPSPPNPRLAGIGLGPEVPREEVIYLSGPMTGYPDYNFPAFHAAAAALRARGLTAISPAELGEVPGWTHADYLRRDIAVLAQQCGKIVMLPGWRDSRGARCEHQAAGWFGFQIGYYYPTKDELGWVEDTYGRPS